MVYISNTLYNFSYWFDDLQSNKFNILKIRPELIFMKPCSTFYHGNQSVHLQISQDSLLYHF